MLLSFFQANGLSESLHVNPSDLQGSSSRIQEALMGGAIPQGLREEVLGRLSAAPFEGSMVAVRSSGTDEDSTSHSFAGK